MSELALLAKDVFAQKRGIGMVPPFYAETASTKADQSWPLWIVRNETCNSLGEFFPRDIAIEFAAALNEAAENGRN